MASPRTLLAIAALVLAALVAPAPAASASSASVLSATGGPGLGPSRAGTPALTVVSPAAGTTIHGTAAPVVPLELRLAPRARLRTLHVWLNGREVPTSVVHVERHGTGAEVTATLGAAHGAVLGRNRVRATVRVGGRVVTAGSEFALVDGLGDFPVWPTLYGEATDALAGWGITADFTLTNTTELTLADSTLLVTRPHGVVDLTVTADHGTCEVKDAQTFLCRLGDLPPGATAVVQLEAMELIVGAVDPFSSEATFDSPSIDTEGQVFASAVGDVQVNTFTHLVLTATPDTVGAGSPVDVMLLVEADDNFAPPAFVTATLTIPPGFVVDPGSPSPGCSLGARTLVCRTPEAEPDAYWQLTGRFAPTASPGSYALLMAVTTVNNNVGQTTISRSITLT